MIAIETLNADELSYRQYYSQYLSKGRPVLIRNALKNMPANDWTPEHFRKKHAGKTFQTMGEPLSIANLMKQFDADPAGISKKHYLTNINIKTDFPEIIDDLSGAPTYARFNWCRSQLVSRLLGLDKDTTSQFFMGVKGSGFPFMHVDYPPYHTFSGLFYGEKEWLVAAPNEAKNLYPIERSLGWPVTSAIEDPFDADHERYPLYKNAQVINVVQQPGDLLFVPSGWWHTARNNTNTITVAWDHLCSSSWNQMLNWRLRGIDNQKFSLLKPVFGTSMKLLGKAVNTIDYCQSFVDRPSTTIV